MSSHQIPQMLCLFAGTLVALSLISILINSYFKEKLKIFRCRILKFIMLVVLFLVNIIFEVIHLLDPIEYGIYQIAAPIILFAGLVSGIIAIRCCFMKVNKFIVFINIFSVLILFIGMTKYPLFGIDSEFFIIAGIFMAVIFVPLLIIDFLIYLIGGKKRIVTPKISRITKKNIIINGIIIVLLLVVMSFSIFTLSPKQELTHELNIYLWKDSLAPGVIGNFEKEFGIKVVERNFEIESVSMEDRLEYYDIVLASDSLVKNMINQGVLSKINKKNIPNLKNIEDRCIIDNFSDYVVPYFWGTTGIIFNTKYVDKSKDSWSILWDIKYSGKISLINNPSEVFGMVAKYIGLPLVPTNDFELKKVKEFLLIQKPLLAERQNESEILKKIISEELWAAQLHDGTAREAISKNPNLKYIIPKEGGSQRVDSFVILKNSSNKRAAEIFINYIMSDEVNSHITKYQKVYSCNSKTMNLLGSDFLDDISKSKLRLLEWFSSYEESIYIIKAKNKLWKELIK